MSNDVEKKAKLIVDVLRNEEIDQEQFCQFDPEKDLEVGVD